MNRKTEIQDLIETNISQLEKLEQNYQTSKNICSIAKAKQFKVQIEYQQQELKNLKG
jgi:hypothetical protein